MGFYVKNRCVHWRLSIRKLALTRRIGLDLLFLGSSTPEPQPTGARLENASHRVWN